MIKIYDYICNNPECKLYEAEIELFVHDELSDEQKCESCEKKLHRILSATPGRVKGTTNPVKRFTQYK